MFRNFLTALLVLAAPNCQAQIFGLQFGTPATTSCPANDGASGAPAGASTPYPTLLNSYTKTIKTTLNCSVAGVDYAVGANASTATTDWQALGAPYSVNVGTKIVTLNGQTNFTVSNVDFSLHNGAILNITSSTGTIVDNTIFGGTNLQTIGNAVIIVDAASGGITVRNSTIDGGGAGTGSTLINSSVGNATVQYNYFKNFPQQVLSVGNSSGTITYKYNLIENGAQQSGAHLNYLQLGNGTYAITVQFNTSKQSLQAGGAGEGYQFYAGVTGQATLTSPSIQYNTMIATGSNSMSYMIHGNCHASADCASTGSITSSGLANNNYFDLTGALGAFYPSSASVMWTNWTLSNNWNMSSGAAISNSP